MSPQKGPRDLDAAILAMLAGHGEGLTREALQRAVGLEEEEPWRFRRRLESLERRQRIRKVGITRGMRYVIGTSAPPAPTGIRGAVWEHSPEGAQVLALVDRPRDQRPPCTYERSFLDAYHPNETFYLPDPADEGRLRQSPVSIGDSVYVPLAVPQLIAEAFEQMLLTAHAIRDPFEQSFFLLVHLPYLQPFADANKRTSRLAVNLPLLKRNLQPLSFPDVPREAYLAGTLAVYENQRVEALRDVYLWAYQRSSERDQAIRRSMGEPDPFRLRYRAELREAVRQIVRSSQSASDVRKGIADYLAAAVPTGDQIRFQVVVSQELRNLNEGTYARYGPRPSEFEAWKPVQAEWAERAERP